MACAAPDSALHLAGELVRSPAPVTFNSVSASPAALVNWSLLTADSLSANAAESSSLAGSRPANLLSVHRALPDNCRPPARGSPGGWRLLQARGKAPAEPRETLGIPIKSSSVGGSTPSRPALRGTPNCWTISANIVSGRRGTERQLEPASRGRPLSGDSGFHHLDGGRAHENDEDPRENEEHHGEQHLDSRLLGLFFGHLTTFHTHSVRLDTQCLGD